MCGRLYECMGVCINVRKFHIVQTALVGEHVALVIMPEADGGCGQ